MSTHKASTGYVYHNQRYLSTNFLSRLKKHQNLHLVLRVAMILRPTTNPRS